MEPNKNKRVKNGTYCRRRGHSFERLIAKLLRELWPKSKRGLQYQDGHYAADVEGTPFRIECSRGRDDILKKWKQVTRDKELSNDHRPPMVIKKWDYIDAVVVLPLAIFYEIQFALKKAGIVCDYEKKKKEETN